MTPEQFAQLQAFVREQLQSGASEEALQEMIKKEGGWSDEDLVPLFSPHGMASATLSNESPTQSPTEPSVPHTSIPSMMTNATTEPAQQAPQAPGVNKSHKHALKLGLTIVAMLAVGGVVAYAGYKYADSIDLFSRAPYTKENILGGILRSLAGVETGTYTITAMVEAQSRDESASPFVLSETPELIEYYAAYDRDVKRMNDVSMIRQVLSSATNRNEYGYYSYGYYTDEDEPPAALPYPATSEELEKIYVDFFKEQRYSYYTRTNGPVTGLPRDPKTGAPYVYRGVQGNDSYELEVEFETYDAIRAITRWATKKEEESYPHIDKKKVTITPDTSGYFYLSSSPPVPLIVELGEEMRMLPPDLSGSLSVRGTTNLRDQSSARWDFSVDALGDLGDMTYKFAFDVRKVDADYYFQLRNMPGLFLTWFPIPKDEWIRISPDEYENDENGYSYSSNFLEEYAAELPNIEEQYTEQREAVGQFLRKVLTIAEESDVVYFKSEPLKEEIEQQVVYRYDLGINKDGLIAFLTQVFEAASQDEYVSKYPWFTDTGLLEYLQSDVFGEIFNYYTANMSLLVYVDREGRLVKAEHSLRVVPPDTAVQLKDKQFRVALNLLLTNINEPLNIDAPAEARGLQDVIEEIERKFDSTPVGSSLSNARERAQLAAFKQEVQATLPALVVACDDSKTKLQTHLSDMQPTYAEPGVLQNADCGYSGKGTFSVTMVSLDKTLCNDEPLEATITESGITYNPDLCESTVEY